mgnify:CR=1 FL=1
MEVRISKGKNISLKGSAEKVISDFFSETYSLKPINFHGLKPKLSVKVGDSVLAGDSLFFDKNFQKIQFVSPVSGKIESIIRGEKRKLLEIVIKANKKNRYKKYNLQGHQKYSNDKLKDLFFESGLWTLIKQRPFSVCPDPMMFPKSIFISCFDSSPLAPDYDFILFNKQKEFQKGIDIISSFCNGKIHLNVDGEADSDFFREIKGVQLNKFFGPHPAGNVGVQIHHLDPINKGDIVWTLSPQSLVTIGNFFLTGKYENYKTIAVTGSEVKKPRYFNVFQGVNIFELLKGNLKSGKKRFISGNVLHGDAIDEKGHVGFFEDQITIIPEGDYFELFGWAMPGLKKYSFSRAFLSSLFPQKKLVLDTNMHGEERAYVVSGQYESVVPMDIFPVQLIKSILVEDIELMEKLGIYEVSPEDFALCEFACTSKMPVQDILRHGLDLVKKECS